MVFQLTWEKIGINSQDGSAQYDEIRSEFHFVLISLYSEFKPVMEFLNNLVGARNRVGIGLSYRPASLHSLAELVPWKRFLGSLKV
jgi:hypothetical protein